ncbi:hypothetical protein [Ruegeria sp. EL01]|jgi:hypothetical protein|uniref:hypothetical protein n=1 Tax=Ruegeria sp. EL01 TaxID=2107578 RepID=UPI000EA82886|nr:hypothetical protein [Ruegeria sp. EL01]
MESISGDETGLFENRIHLIGLPPRTRVPLGDLMQTAISVRQGVIDQDWPSLADQGLRCLALGHASFRLLQEAETVASARDQSEHRQAEHYANLLMNAVGGGGGQAFLEGLREKLADSDPAARLESAISRIEHRLGQELKPSLKSRIRSASKTIEERVDLDASVAMLEEGKTKDVPLLELYSFRLAASQADQIKAQSDLVLSCLSRGLLARVHAEFHLSQRTNRAPSRSSDIDRHHQATEAVLVNAERWLERGQRRIYCALAGQESADHTARAAMALAVEIERRLPIFVRTQGAIRQTMLFLRDDGKGAASERMGRLAARAGMLTREAIASHCASYRMALHALSLHPPEEVDALMRRTETTAFDGPLPNGRDVPLKDLDAVNDGDFVEIEGFVRSLEALRLGDGKLVSRVVLHDPSSDTTANAVAIFAHLPHAGVTLDSFVRANGLFKAGSTLFGGEPAVEIDALALNDLGQSSWRVAFLGLADRWFEPWRNGANLIWSLGPHGLGDDDEMRFGAGELLYLPLFRR